MKNSNDLRRQRIAWAVSEYRRTMKARCIAYLGGACKVCGYNKSHAALEFHHRDPSSKEFQLSTGRTKGWERTKSELDKCDLLCSNCHREVHGAWRSSDMTALQSQLEAIRRPNRVNVLCDHCGGAFTLPPSKVQRHSKHFCKKECRIAGSAKITWPPLDTLLQMVRGSSVSAVARRLGVSGKSVSRRMRA